MRKIIVLLLFIYISFAVQAQLSSLQFSLFGEDATPKREVRATWIATIGGIDWPSSYAQNTSRSIEKQKNELRDILDRLQQGGINTVLLQTRIRATTIYPSKHEPWDGC